MALKFRKVRRKVMGGPEAGKMKYYAMACSSGFSGMDKMCELICSRSALSSADVKGVLDSLNWAMGVELKSGNIVQLGELGNFRLTLSSEGAEKKKELDANSIRKARIIFTPGAELRLACRKVNFVPEKEEEKECNHEAGGEEPEEPEGV